MNKGKLLGPSNREKHSGLEYIIPDKLSSLMIRNAQHPIREFQDHHM